MGEIIIILVLTTFLSSFFSFFNHHYRFSGYFYIYQMMSLWVWFYYSYYYMGLVLSVVIIVSGITKVTVSLKAQRKVLDMAAFNGVTVPVLRDGAWNRMDGVDLVPGDIIEIEPMDVGANHHTLCCDVVVLVGGAVADESSLTGEALPVAK